MSTKYVTSKENIAALIQEVQKTNALMVEAQPKDDDRNSALENIAKDIKFNIGQIAAETWATAYNTKYINDNIVSLAGIIGKHQEAIMDLAVSDTYALQKINNELVDSSEGMKAMQDAAQMDRLKQQELMAEQAKQNEAVIVALKSDRPTIPGSDSKGKKQKDGSGGKFGKMMADLGQGMFNAGKGLLAMGAAVWILADAFGKFSKISWTDMSKGLITLAALAIAGKVMAKGGGKDSWKAFLAIGGAMLILASAFEQFAKLDYESIGKGLLVLGTLAIATKLMSGSSGAITILAVAGAMYILSDAFGKFGALDWETMGKGLLVLAALTAVTIALGLASPVVLTGALAMLAIGAAMYVAAKAFEVVAESMTNFTAGLKELADIDGGRLAATAGALGLLGIAMAAFGAGSAAAGLGTLISNLLTIGKDSPVEQILKLSNAGDGLLKTADGLSRIADAMAKFAAISPDTMKAINDFPWVRMTAFASAGGQITANGASVGKPAAAAAAPQAEQLAAVQQKNTQSQGVTEISRAEANVQAMAEGRRPSFDRARPEGGKYSGGGVVPLTSRTTNWDPEDAMARGAN